MLCWSLWHLSVVSYHDYQLSIHYICLFNEEKYDHKAFKVFVAHLDGPYAGFIALTLSASLRPHCRAFDGYMMLNIVHDLFINTRLAEEGIFKCSILN